MATTSSPQSSWQPHHHASSWEVWDRERVNSGLKTLAGAKPCVFAGKVAVRGRRRRVSVSAVSRLDRGKWSTKRARDCGESSISYVSHIVISFISIISILSCQFIHSLIHFNWFISSHSFQFINFIFHLNSFISIQSFQFVHLNLFMPIHSFQVLHVKSFVSIPSF
jgi:hypothetical protein